jgi:hypothetical protein
LKHRLPAGERILSNVDLPALCLNEGSAAVSRDDAWRDRCIVIFCLGTVVIRTSAYQSQAEILGPQTRHHQHRLNASTSLAGRGLRYSVETRHYIYLLSSLRVAQKNIENQYVRSITLMLSPIK